MKNEIKNKQHDNVSDDQSSFSYSLYELLLEASTLPLSMFVSIKSKSYSSTSISEDTISAKLRLSEIELHNQKVINNLEIINLKRKIKKGYNLFLKSNNPNIYTNIYYSENIENKILSSDIFINKLYNFLSLSKKQKINPIIFINNIQITKKDLTKTVSEFTIHLNSIINKKQQTLDFSNLEITQDNKEINISVFKRIDILSNLLNSDINNVNCLDFNYTKKLYTSKRLNNCKMPIFTIINIA